MKLIKYIFSYVLILSVVVSCVTDEDELYSFDYVQAPTNVAAVFDITQDNTGFVTIFPNAEGAVKFEITFGDDAEAEPQVFGLSDEITHTYTEGVYQVGVAAVGPTGLKTEVAQELNVTFKAPQDLTVSITKDESNPKIVTVTPTALYATLFDVYFGLGADEVPIRVMPGESATYTYETPGDYEVKVIAKSAGAATSEQLTAVTIDAASDPIFLPITFESFTVNYAYGDFGGLVGSVVDNPVMSGINESARVGQAVKTSGAETWAGTSLTLGEAIDFSSKKNIKIKVLSPKAGAIVLMKIENKDDNTIASELQLPTTVSGEWEELDFDFSAIDVTKEYHRVVLFFDFGNTGDDAVYYFDDIKQVFAQAPSSSMVDDFEGTAPTFEDFGGTTTTIVANPDATGVNVSATVAQQVKGAGAETWAGTVWNTGSALDFSTFGKISVKVWSPKVGATVKLKVENADDGNLNMEVDLTTTVANAWEELVYDFSTIDTNNEYQRVVIFFDFGNTGDDAVYYFDDVKLTNGEEDLGLSLDDFEGTAPTFEDFGGTTTAIVSNPVSGGINTSANVAQQTKGDGAETWAGTVWDTGSAIDFDSFGKIKVKVYSPKAGATIKLKVENRDNGDLNMEVDLTTSVANQWEELTYDFSTIDTANEYHKVVIFFDFGNTGDNSVYYFDDLVQVN